MRKTHEMDAPTAEEMWAFLLQGYLLTVLIELPVLWFGLSPRHTRSTRIVAGFWLTACTYPVVILVLPLTVWRWFGYGVYLLVAETFAPVAEVVLFLWMVPPASPESAAAQGGARRDFVAIVGANLASFLLGLGLQSVGVL